jgi:hypothetical protein
LKTTGSDDFMFELVWLSSRGSGDPWRVVPGSIIVFGGELRLPPQATPTHGCARDNAELAVQRPDQRESLLAVSLSTG